jgi:hypothetical protein
MSGRVLRALFATLLLVLAIAPSAAAYEGEGTFRITLSGPSGAVRCDKSALINLTARLTRGGQPAVGESVTWSLRNSPSRRDRLSDTHTTTNGRGKSSVRLTFGLVEGRRTVVASMANGDSTARITVRCAGGLPETFPDLPGTASLIPAAAAPIGGLLAIAFGFALLGRRRLRRPGR